MTFVERNRAVAAEFLQSAIIFDDLPYFEGGDDAQPEAENVPAPPDETERFEAAKPHELVVPRNEPEPEYEVGINAKQLGDAFGREGLICGFLKPTAGDAAATGDLVVNAARRADIVILDWSIERDQGDKTLGVIDQILAADDERGEERLRLIAIYTSRLETEAILDRVSESVGRHLAKHTAARDQFAITKGPLRIALYAKQTAHVEGTPASERALSEDELPARLVAEFAAMATGLVPLVALAGLAAIRAETHRILTVLNDELDPAYVAQRILVSDPFDAAEQLVGFVTAELRSVMEDKKVAGTADDEAILDWLRWRTANGDAVVISQGDDDVGDLAALLEHGLSQSASAEAGEITALREKEHLKELLNRRRQADTVTRLFTRDEAEANAANDQYAMQASLRTQYSNPPRILQLGTLVRDLAGNHLLCVQPLCDSIRIGTEREFPFLPVVESDNEFDIVVRDPEGIRRTLLFQRKPYMLRKISFRATDGVDCVQAVESTRDFRFMDASDNPYVWVARLDETYAQRVVHGLGAALSRIGVGEFEWLRSKAPRSTSW